MSGIIISSGYYLLDEYMKYSESIHALIVGDPKFFPDIYKNNEKIHFTFHYDADGIAKDILNTGIKFDFIYCIDDKFVDRIGEISKMTGISTCQLSGEIARDKYLLKEYLKRENILFPQTRVFMDISELKKYEDIQFPVIIKPSNSYGSNGVFLIKNHEELLRCANHIFMQNIFHKKFYHDNSGFLMCEEYIYGEEYAVDVIWNDGIPVYSMISSRLHNIVGNMFPDYVYYIDKDLSKDRKEEIETIVHRVGRAIGMQYGVTHTELREKNGKLYILENAVRPGGGGCMYELHRLKTNINYFELYMRTMTMNNINVGSRDETSTNDRYYFFLTYANSNIGKVMEAGIREELLPKTIKILKKHILVKPGDVIRPNEERMRYTIFVFGEIYAKNKDEFNQLIGKLNNSCYIKTEEETSYEKMVIE